MAEVAIGATGALLVWIFYRVLESNFPEIYFTRDSVTDPMVNRTFPRYCAWRLGPVFIAGLACATTADRLRLNVSATLIVLFAAHVVTTIGRALAVAVRRHVKVPLPLVLLYAAITCGAALACLVAGLTRNLFDAMVPQPDVLLQSLWLGGFAALIGSFLANAFDGSRPTAALVQRSRQELSPELHAEAERVAAEYGTDPRIVTAVMLVENLQRPRWVRRIESSRVGRWFGSGTTGVMQVRSATPLTDAESIRAAVERHLAGLQLPGIYDHGRVSRNPYPVTSALTDYNQGQTWQHLVEAVLEELAPDEGFSTLENPGASSTAFAPDELPQVAIEELKLDAGRLQVRGSFALGGQPLVLRMLDSSGHAVAAPREVPASDPRTEFTEDLGELARAVAVVAGSRAADSEVEDGGHFPPFARARIPQEWRAAQTSG